MSHLSADTAPDWAGEYTFQERIANQDGQKIVVAFIDAPFVGEERMNRIYKRLLKWAGAFIALAAFAPAMAQISNVTDGTTASTACTSYTFSASGVLTFSPAGCLTSTTPPPASPVYSFTVGSAQVVETTATTTVTVRRTGANLATSPAGSVIVRWTGGTAAANTNFKVDVPPFGSVGSDFQATIAFTQPAAGTTTQEVSFNVYVVNASLQGGTSKTVIFGLLSPSDGNLGATTTHTLTIASALPPPTAADVSTSGTVIPDTLPTGYYAGKTVICEAFTAVNNPGDTAFGTRPGPTQYSPCGGYDYAVSNANHSAGAYNCNAGMSGIPTPATSLKPQINNSVTSATMLLLEDLKINNTWVPGVDLRYPQHQYNAFILKFRTGNAGEMTGAVSGTNIIGKYSFAFSPQENRGEVAPRFAALSTKPCDFDYAKFDMGNGCYKTIDSFGSMYAHVLNDGGQAEAGKCGLQPNTVYYLSTRWEDAGSARGLTSCKPGFTNQVGINYCGTSLSIN